VPKNKKRKPPSATPYQLHPLDLTDHRNGIASVLDFIEHQDQYRPNIHAGPSSYIHPEPEPIAPLSLDETDLETPWSFMKPPLAHEPNHILGKDKHLAVKGQIDVEPGPYIDADGFSDLLIGSDRQAEMMADS
jgi:hypothetical protein